MAQRKGKRLSKQKELKREINRRHQRKLQLGGAPRMYACLAKIAELIEDGELEEADDALAELHKEYPNALDVLQVWSNVCLDLQDTLRHESVCEKLHKLDPGDSDVALMLAGLYLSNGQLTLAHRQFGKFLERFPTDPRAASASETRALVRAALENIWLDLGSPANAAEITELHERTLAALKRGELDLVCSLCEQLLVLKPDFLPAFNNLAESQLLLGNIDLAIETLRRGLQVEPGNSYSQGSLSRATFLAGRQEEARRLAGEFTISGDTTADALVRQAEAHLLLGNNDRIPKLLEWGSAREKADSRLFHLAAVAAMRLADEAKAKELWRLALHDDPDRAIASDNLEDLQLPIGDRNGPCAFPLSTFLSRDIVFDISREFQRHRDADPNLETFLYRRLVERQPHLPHLVPFLLELGDTMGRELAISIAKNLDAPELRTMLVEFCQGSHGPDEVRFKLANDLANSGVIPSGVCDLYVRGQQRRIRLFGFEIHEEFEQVHGPRVQQLAEDACEALNDHDGAGAERLLKEALELEPDKPDLLNNLGAAWQLQGRTTEVNELVMQIHARFPDYLFGRTGRAIQLAAAGDYEGALALLDPLIERRRFHVTEFAALCEAQIQVHMAKRDKESANSWLNLWEQSLPDHPKIPYWRGKITGNMFGRLRGLLNPLEWVRAIPGEGRDTL